MTRRQILACAFTCCPPGTPGFRGGEDVLGWNLLLQIAKHHDIWVLTSEADQPSIERKLEEDPITGLNFRFVKLPKLLTLFLKFQGSHQFYYYIWQIKAYLIARKLHKEMDEAVLKAYGWNDLDLAHDFYEVDYLPENDRVRYTISPKARKEVLKRLLLLNHEIYEEENKIKIMVKGHLHTDVLMRAYLKKEFGLLGGKRLSHIWHMSGDLLKKPLFITDGALNVAPRVDIKLHILRNAIEFANKTGLIKPKVAILSGTEDPIESMPSSVEAEEVMKLAKKENVNAYVHGPLALDNAISKEAAKIKNIQNDVAGDADILLVPNLETGNSLSKIMVYLMQACAAGIIVGGKVPVVLPSRADNKISKLASIAASIIATH